MYVMAEGVIFVRLEKEIATASGYSVLSDISLHLLMLQPQAARAT
jgi:hypothetical protein